MKPILIRSEQDKTDTEKLIKKQIPSYRQAYSDRTCWLMACMSELAYLRFNPLLPDKQKNRLVILVAETISEDSKTALLALMEKIAYDHEDEKKALESELSHLQYKLFRTFDNEGTQAILVTNEKYVTLAFRGTETTSFKDIKTDVDAVIQRCETGGNIHRGFQEAYEQVAGDIEAALNADELKSKPLFITGHSLGGALATIAAKKITHKGGNAACYTFGAPRVGDEEWVSNIKTPIYRIVNAADCITMLPPGESLRLIAWLVGLIPSVGGCCRAFLLSKFGGYIHGGNMRYLTNCGKNAYEDVKLLYSVSWFYRLKAFVFKKLPWKKLLADHSISVYRKKLRVIAQRRNSLR